MHDPVSEWTQLTRAEVEARVAEGRWLVYFYGQSYCATDCVAVAAFAKAHPEWGVAEVCPPRQPTWEGAIPRLPAIHVYTGGAVAGSTSGGPVTLEALESLAEEASP